MTDFNAILSQQADSIEKPKPMPTGTYDFIVKRHEFGTSSQKKTPFVRFFNCPQSPNEDVDMDALTKVNNWTQKEMKLDFFLTADAQWRLVDFLTKLGMNMSGRTLGELIPETTGQMFKGFVKQEVSAKNPEDIFANIDSYTSV